jgi:hypothetical protein
MLATVKIGGAANYSTSHFVAFGQSKLHLLAKGCRKTRNLGQTHAPAMRPQKRFCLMVSWAGNGVREGLVCTTSHF